MTNNQTIIGEETHILDAKNRIKMLEKVGEDYGKQLKAALESNEIISRNLIEANEYNALLKNTVDFWRGSSFAALVLAASSIAALVACLLGVIG